MSHLAVWIHTPFAQALGWTLLHFVWEGAALAAVLMALLRVFRHEPAQRRYTLACFILAAMPVVFAITLAVIWARRPVAIAAPIHWVAAPPAAGPIELPAPRFWWRGLLDRLAWLVPAWFAGVTFFYARALAGWAAVRRLRRRGVCAPPTEWQGRLDELAARLRIARPVALLESCLTDTPVLIGYLRPAILLPLGCLTGLTVAQVECILLHELAHVVRHDYVVNLLQSLVEGLLFYHPAVWWVSHVVRTERENCCDDRAVELTGNARAYAATLAALEERRALAPAGALAATGGNLMERIRRLTMESRGAQASVAPAASAAVLLVIFAAALTALPSKLPGIRHAHRPAPATLAGFAAAAATPQEPAANVAAPYKKWLDEDVVYIVNNEERTAFLRLTSNAEREKFIEQFWKRRDPTPDTEKNEFREEHYRRIAYANEHFAGTVPGWRTDRGRTYIMYGPPDEIDDHASGGSYRRPPEEGGGTVDTYPFQQWRYRFVDGLGTNVTIEFVDRFGTGDFPMTSDPHEKERTPYRQWLLEDVAFIITPEERAAFQKLASDGEREKFIEQFWQRRGAGSREEHYRRIAYANDHFRSGVPGWKTDMERTYIAYGFPDAISMGATAMEWSYRHVEGVGDNIRVVFENTAGNGEYRIVKDPKQDQAAKVFASNEGPAVSVIVPGKGERVTPGTIRTGDVLEVLFHAPAGTTIDQVIARQRAECAALENKSLNPDAVTCRDQLGLLEDRQGDMASEDARQKVSQMRVQENTLRGELSASRARLQLLERQSEEATRDLKAVQDRMAASQAIVQKHDMLQSELNLAKHEYAQLAAKGDASSPLVNQAKDMLKAKEAELAVFEAENQRSLRESLQANLLVEVQAKQAIIAHLQQQIAEELQRIAVLEVKLANNKSLQAELYATHSPAARQLITRVTVGSDGKIALDGRGAFTASGLSPTQLEAAIGESSSVRITESASRMVTVLVPLASARDRFHVFGEVKTANGKIVQTFMDDTIGRPALAHAVPLRAGSYHLVVVMKNLDSGSTYSSELDFTVD